VTTLADVARAAAVSPSTVSRYLSGQLRLQPATERRIQQAVQVLKYIPNASAKRLAGGSTGVLGLVLPDMSNPFFASFADATAQAALGHDLTIMLCATRDSRENEERYTDLLAARAVDGLIYVGMHARNPRLAQAIADGLPVVIVDELLEEVPSVSTISVDNFSGAFQATRYLTGLGHRCVAYVGGPAELMTEKERRRGYTAALGQAGLGQQDDLMFSGPYSEDTGVSALPRILTHPSRPTAVFCASDYTALGLLSAVDLLGVTVPGDLSVVGFDDAQVVRYTRPKLTTVRQPVSALAAGAVDLVLERVGDASAGPRQLVLPVELIVRDSAAPPAQPPVTGRTLE
jgi:DNA-binding LacI/PurR family transcriptional regulator